MPDLNKNQVKQRKRRARQKNAKQRREYNEAEAATNELLEKIDGALSEGKPERHLEKTEHKQPQVAISSSGVDINGKIVKIRPRESYRFGQVIFTPTAEDLVERPVVFTAPNVYHHAEPRKK